MKIWPLAIAIAVLAGCGTNPVTGQRELQLLRREREVADLSRHAREIDVWQRELRILAHRLVERVHGDLAIAPAIRILALFERSAASTASRQQDDDEDNDDDACKCSHRPQRNPPWRWTEARRDRACGGIGSRCRLTLRHGDRRRRSRARRRKLERRVSPQRFVELLKSAPCRGNVGFCRMVARVLDGLCRWDSRYTA